MKVFLQDQKELVAVHRYLNKITLNIKKWIPSPQSIIKAQFSFVSKIYDVTFRYFIGTAEAVPKNVIFGYSATG